MTCNKQNGKPLTIAEPFSFGAVKYLISSFISVTEIISISTSVVYCCSICSAKQGY